MNIEPESEPRIVTPEEAQKYADMSYVDPSIFPIRLAYTVATEPERIAQAVAEVEAREARLREQLGEVMGERNEAERELESEPDRTRAAVVKALQDLAESNFYDGDSDRPCDGYNDLIDRAIAIQNGADL